MTKRAIFLYFQFGLLLLLEQARNQDQPYAGWCRESPIPNPSFNEISAADKIPSKQLAGAMSQAK